MKKYTLMIDSYGNDVMGSACVDGTLVEVTAKSDRGIKQIANSRYANSVRYILDEDGDKLMDKVDCCCGGCHECNAGKVWSNSKFRVG